MPVVQYSLIIDGNGEESFCLRFVAKNLQPREEFIGLYQVTSTTFRKHSWGSQSCSNSPKSPTITTTGSNLRWGSQYVWQDARCASSPQERPAFCSVGSSSMIFMFSRLNIVACDLYTVCPSCQDMNMLLPGLGSNRLHLTTLRN